MQANNMTILGLIMLSISILVLSVIGQDEIALNNITINNSTPNLSPNSTQGTPLVNATVTIAPVNVTLVNNTLQRKDSLNKTPSYSFNGQEKILMLGEAKEKTSTYKIEQKPKPILDVSSQVFMCDNV
ncbi:MAG: hypothetical protein LUQ22_05385 [Methanotrichaceae archaeon]|nr:hypothetical protein [Methanotrichaceae archaeon]